MFKLFKNNKVGFLNPIAGEVIDMTKVPDDVFAGKMMGDGFAVIPKDNQVYSPIDGTILKVFKTKHALLIKGDSGLEIILHIGIGTVELKGEGFTIHVEDGAQVKAGDHVATVDLDYLTSMEKSTVTPVVITNMEKVKNMDISFGEKSSKEEVCTVAVNK
jgi:PTS system glucose-specific IIC component